MKRRALLAVFACLSLGTVPSFAEDVDTDTIVVTARRYAVPSETVQQTLLREQASTTIVTAEDIARNQYTTTEEILRNVNGLSIQDQVPGMSSYIRLNGSDRVLVLVDGQSIANGQSSGFGRGTTDLSALPHAADVERVEITRGSGSVKYGSGSVGGVVNIITKKSKRSRTMLEANTGSWGTHDMILTHEGTQDKTSWYVSGNIAQRSYYKFGNTQGTDNADSDYRNMSLTARIDQRFSDADSLTLYAFHKTVEGHYTLFDTTQAEAFIPSFDKKTKEPTVKRIERLYNNASITYHMDEDTDMPGFIRYYNDYTKTYWTNRYHTRTQGVQAEKGWHTGLHRITAGMEWTRDEGTNEAAGYMDKSRNNTAVYAEDALVWKKWTITPGVRYDHSSVYGDHTTPRIAVNYKAGSTFNVYGNWGRVFNPPRFNDLYYYKESSKNGIPSVSRGSEHIQAETGYTQTLGCTYTPSPNTTLDISIFRSNLTNAIDWMKNQLIDGIYVSEVRNLNRERKRGLDITLHRIVNDRWEYTAGYSYIHAEIDEGKGLCRDTTYNRPNGYHAGVNFHTGPWHAAVSMNAGTGRDDTYYVAGSYVIWDAAVSYAVNADTTVYAKVNNITNKGYDLYHSFPEYGRYFQMGVKYTF